jgi:hypothetical protein
VGSGNIFGAAPTRIRRFDSPSSDAGLATTSVNAGGLEDLSMEVATSWQDLSRLYKPSTRCAQVGSFPG